MHTASEAQHERIKVRNTHGGIFRDTFFSLLGFGLSTSFFGQYSPTQSIREVLFQQRVLGLERSSGLTVRQYLNELNPSSKLARSFITSPIAPQVAGVVIKDLLKRKLNPEGGFIHSFGIAALSGAITGAVTGLAGTTILNINPSLLGSGIFKSNFSFLTAASIMQQTVYLGGFDALKGVLLHGRAYDSFFANFALASLTSYAAVWVSANSVAQLEVYLKTFSMPSSGTLVALHKPSSTVLLTRSIPLSLGLALYEKLKYRSYKKTSHIYSGARVHDV